MEKLRSKHDQSFLQLELHETCKESSGWENSALLKLLSTHESAGNLGKMQIWFSRAGVWPKGAFLTSPGGRCYTWSGRGLSGLMCAKRGLPLPLQEGCKVPPAL